MSAVSQPRMIVLKCLIDGENLDNFESHYRADNIRLMKLCVIEETLLMFSF